MFWAFFFESAKWNTQAEAVIAHLEKYKYATTWDFNNLKVNGNRIANVSKAVYKARKKLKESGKTILCQQTLIMGKKKVQIEDSYWTYWIANLSETPKEKLISLQ